MKKSIEQILHQVPVDYYQNGVSANILQRLWHSRKLVRVVEMIKLSENTKRILDVGSASGWFLSEIAKNFPKSKCTGIDLYEDAIEYGRKKYKNIMFVHADAHKLPFPKNSFDIVICCEVLEHVVEPDVVIKEIKRVLTPQGKVVIELDSGNFLFKLVWYFWTNLRKGVWIDAHLHPFSIKILEELFVKNGFIVKKKRIFNFSMAVIFLLEKKNSP